MKALKKLLKEAYARGFAASGEGYNQEYPFDQHGNEPQSDVAWRKNRDKALKTLLEESKPSPRQKPSPVTKPIDWHPLKSQGNHI